MDFTKTILKLTSDAVMFTAFDITKILRDASPQTNIRHGEVREHLNELFCTNQMQGYVRDLVDIDCLEVFLYHLQGTDVSQYNPKAILEANA